ncbi:hypothetical protein L210DRAFT_3581016 [Boletus edulis BED1]|uniref:Uncharacterized protein n=1 Tax=Boletus edulis BED1 TaxID=1328754 RepID=A0AAD4BBC5_BOLED|nr:hypothetical protein L210DRAFT_3581016 [Boletus edulis BED1]
MQTLVTNYLPVWVVNTLVMLLFTRARAQNRSPFFLGRAEAQGSVFEPYTLQAGTNSRLFVRQQDQHYHHSLPTRWIQSYEFITLLWNYTLPSTGPVAEHVDSAGGRTSCHSPRL